MSRPRRWVLDGAQERLGEVLARLVGEDRSALSEGRVFVNGKRLESEAAWIASGDVLEIGSPRPSHGEGRILAFGDGMVFADKPAGIPTEPDRSGRRGCLLDAVAQLLGVRPTTLHAASRLDTGVSGVVPVAVTPAGRRQLETWRAEGRLRKRYVGLAAGALETPRGTWTERIVDAQGRRTRPAMTRYAVVATQHTPKGGTVSLLAMEPVTGRTHQLRIHAARAKAPLLGDRAHGGPHHLVMMDGGVAALDRVALHAAWIAVEGCGKERWESPIPTELMEWWNRLGGNVEAWSAVREVSLS